MTAPAPNPHIKWGLEEIARSAAQAARPRDYYEGRHPLAFATEKFREAFGAKLKELADNLMPVIVDTPADRLEVAAFKTGRAAPDEVAREIWRRNRMEVRAGQVHQDAFVDGNAYVIVWPDPREPQMPIFYPNRAAVMAIRYDEEQPGYIVRAAKAWQQEDGRSRLTLYYADRVEKYVTRGKAEGGVDMHASHYEPLEVEGEPWPLPHPFEKVPVFHFANRAGIGEMGRSELVEAIPLADVLNKTLCDRIVAQEFYAFNQRYAIGLDPAEMEKAKVRPGGIWATPNTSAKFGEFQASDIGRYAELAESDRKEIARVSRTPLHYFTLEGNFPSGESQKTADGPLLSKVRKRQAAWGMVWADAMRLALTMAGASERDVETVWANTEPRSEKEELQKAVLKRELDVSERTVYTELGYTPEQIDRIREERATEDVVPTMEQ